MANKEAAPSEIRPRAKSCAFIHSAKPDQNAFPTKTTGRGGTLPVYTKVRISNNSSSVPKPPGITIYAWE